ncbi:unnamed protein product [Schistocephalus solidus]|uniref:Secreted protein n=1 Tax=Schistocephalus solidus TaxID=70667 RepID=A0A183S7S2_SCHSO|nr:unnamed protein product [Schistocephalus solidus]
MLLWSPLTGTQLSTVAPRSWVLPSGYTPGNRHNRRDKLGEGLRCCVCLKTRYAWLQNFPPSPSQNANGEGESNPAGGPG